jgi:hypothetical protein
MDPHRTFNDAGRLGGPRAGPQPSTINLRPDPQPSTIVDDICPLFHNPPMRLPNPQDLPVLPGASGQTYCSVKTVTTIASVVSLLVLGGCSANDADRLLGTWQTQVIPSEWGSNRITMTFFADGRITGTNDLPGHEGALGWQGTYRVKGNVITRTILGRTQEISFRIDGDRMHQKLGDEDYTFTRIITEPNGPANQSQPIRSETNRASAAAGSGR